ncbi:phosphatase [Pseudomonas sp. HMWF032]|uniref:phosphatase n=1 Tax=unclassified Pseudomonas TaxID=196821 RepID=UPI000D3A3A5E|nr:MULTISPECIES: phosphatase [unclassified Pseudomonas]PTS86841.1 phosphatase [Pseudomonas sp. HMWF032]PTT82463.1 phosphatase [Pseudomonas sp. HMWF010]WAC44507.1 HAD family phosphatase [Pseudomonas sp. SL4(2022)]
MHNSASSPAFNAVLFSLSGCLVDFGARSVPLTLQRLYPDAHEPHSLAQCLGREPLPTEWQTYQQALCSTAQEHSETTHAALPLLEQLRQQGVPCAWLDELPRDASICLASALPDWLSGTPNRSHRPWPAPDAIWLSLLELQVEQLTGCVLVSGEPRLLQAALNAGIWTIGLAISGPLCGQAPADWQSLPIRERDRLRSQATLSLYRLGVHSVIDQLSDLPTCLADLSLRRQKGEKP